MLNVCKTCYDFISILCIPGGSVVKNLPAMQEMPVYTLNREDPLEKEMATHSSILAWKIPWPQEPGEIQSMGLQESDTAEHAHTYHHHYVKRYFYIRETILTKLVESTPSHKSLPPIFFSKRKNINSY